MGKSLAAFVATAALCAWSIPATASVILSPVAATSTSTFPNFQIVNTIDQSGLSIGFNSGVDDFNAYFAQNPTHTTLAAGNEWFSASGDTLVTVLYDLGASYNVTQFALWNEEFSGFGIADVSYSTDNVIFSSLGSLSPINNPLNSDYPAELFSLDFTGRYLSMELGLCPQPAGGGHNGCGIGEVAFGVSSSVTPVPLPASLPLLLGGLGVMGLISAWRRRTT